MAVVALATLISSLFRLELRVRRLQFPLFTSVSFHTPRRVAFAFHHLSVRLLRPRLWLFVELHTFPGVVVAPHLARKEPQEQKLMMAISLCPTRRRSVIPPFVIALFVGLHTSPAEPVTYPPLLSSCAPLPRLLRFLLLPL